MKMATEKQIEAAAKEIYDRFRYEGVGVKPAWVPGGNALKQDEARRMARAAIDAAEAAAWQDITSPPTEPCQVEVFYGNLMLTDQHGNACSPVIEPYRDVRREMAYWDGRNWRDLGTGHELFEFADGDDLPTKYRRLTAAPA